VSENTAFNAQLSTYDDYRTTFGDVSFAQDSECSPNIPNHLRRKRRGENEEK